MKKIQKYLLLFIAIAIIVNASLLSVFAQNNEANAILQKQDVYYVGYNPEHSPFSYRGSDDKDAKGMSVEIMNYIAQEAGIRVEYVSLNNIDKDITLDINLSILDADQRPENCISSDPYFKLMMMMISNKDSEQYNGSKIGHLNYISVDEKELIEMFKGSQSVAYTGYRAMQDDMKRGNLDYILTSNLVAQQSESLVQSAESHVWQTDLMLDISLQFNKNMTKEKVDAFNKIIETLDEQSKYNIMLNAAMVGTAHQLSFWDYAQTHQIEILFGAFFFMMVIFAVIVMSSLNKQKALLKALNVDKLTEIMTAQKFIKDATKVLQNASIENPYYLLSIDIDNFKYINESYGYNIGSDVIVAMAKSISNKFPKAICISRISADNFLLLLDEPPQKGFGREISDYCMKHYLGKILGSGYKLLTSTGVYTVERNDVSLVYMMDCANIARRQGKEKYDQTEIYFTKSLELEIRRKNDIITSMEDALTQEEFKMNYQPKISFKTKKVVGAEALVRWYRPNGTQIFPDKFISLFEENGFIVNLDYYVLDQVCKFVAKHKNCPRISVNVSGYSFLQPDLVERMMEILEKNKVSSSFIEIEITESAIVNNYDIVSSHINKFRENGFSIAMDDFGAGLSSLNRLKDINIDVLKIDRAFLEDATISDKSVFIISGIIKMAKRMGIETVAEGIETNEQAQLLEQLDCNVAQGYYYSRPLPENQFLEYLKLHYDECTNEIIE